MSDGLVCGWCGQDPCEDACAWMLQDQIAALKAELSAEREANARLEAENRRREIADTQMITKLRDENAKLESLCREVVESLDQTDEFSKEFYGYEYGVAKQIRKAVDKLRKEVE